MSRLHADRAIVIDDPPELLGDVFAWNKLFRRDFWDSAGLTWPEGSATRTSRPRRAPFLRAGGSPSRPRSSTTGGSAPTARRSPSSGRPSPTSPTAGPPSGWRSPSVAEYGSPGSPGLPRPGAAGDLGRYFVQSPTAPTSGGPAGRGRAGVLGRAVADPQRAAARAPPDRLAGRAGPACGRRAVIAYCARLDVYSPGSPDDGSARLDVPGLDVGPLRRRRSPVRDREV